MPELTIAIDRLNAQLEISRVVDAIRMVLSADQKVLVILLVHETRNAENARCIRCSVVTVEFTSDGMQEVGVSQNSIRGQVNWLCYLNPEGGENLRDHARLAAE